MTTIDSGVRTIDGIELTAKAVAIDGPPVFDTVEEERLHRKQKLAGALRIFGRVGFGEGVAGHITARDPEFPDLFWVNPFGMSFRHVRVSDLILVDHVGQVVYGKLPVNPSGGLKAKGHPIGATGVSMHVLSAMQLLDQAPEGMQIKNAKLAGIFNMGGAAVANYVSILEPAK